MKGTTGFDEMGRRPTLRTLTALLQEFFGERTDRQAFGHRDLQTSPCHTSFYDDLSKKEVFRKTQETRRK